MAELKIFEENGKYGFKDESGKVVIEPNFDSVTPFKNGCYQVGKLKYYGVIDGEGKQIVPCEYYGVYDEVNGFYTCERLPIKYVYSVLGVEYEMVKNFYGDTISVARKDSVYGLVNNHGEELSDFVYSGINNFYCGRALVSKIVNGQRLLGYIDRNGKEIVPCSYQSAGDFYNGIAVVYVGGKTYYIDGFNNKYTRENADKYEEIYEKYDNKYEDIIFNARTIVIDIGDDDSPAASKRRSDAIILANNELKILAEERDSELAKIPKIDESENS